MFFVVFLGAMIEALYISKIIHGSNLLYLPTVMQDQCENSQSLLSSC